MRTKFYCDKIFLVKFILSIHNRINKWLTECGQAQKVEDTSIELLDFNLIILDLKLSHFFCDLPESIKVIEDKTNNNTDSRNKLSISRKRNHSNNN